MFSLQNINQSWLPEFTSLHGVGLFLHAPLFLLLCSLCVSPVNRAELIPHQSGYNIWINLTGEGLTLPCSQD